MRNIESLDLIEKGYLLDDVDFVVNWLAGMYYYKRFEFGNAIDHFENLFLMDSLPNYDSDQINYELAVVCRNFGNYEMSIKYYNRIFEGCIIPTDWDSPIDIAKLLINKSLPYYFSGQYKILCPV